MIKKLAYSLGAFASALSFQTFSTYIVFFYVDVMKLPAYLAGIGILIYAVWNAVNDPLFGFISDRTRSRWGRRIPYLAAGAVPLGIVYFLLWIPPFGDIDQVSLLFLYFVAAICIFDGLYSLTMINWTALFPEMFSTLRERTQISAFRQTFGVLGLFLGVALPPMIFGSAGWGQMGLIFGGAMTLSLLVALWGSRERKEYEYDPPLSFWKALKETLENRSFLTFVFTNLFLQFSLTLILATMPFFVKYVLHLGPQGTAIILGAAFIAVIPMLYIWEILADRFGAKRCFLAALALLAAALTPLFFTREIGLILLCAPLIGAGLAGFLLLVDVLLADIIDEDEANNGSRREGMFFGMNALITRFAIGLEAFFMSTVFVLSGYSPYIFTQPREFEIGLRFLLAGLPVTALLLGLVIMAFYPLAGKRLDELKQKVAEIHAKKGITQGY